LLPKMAVRVKDSAENAGMVGYVIKMVNDKDCLIMNSNKNSMASKEATVSKDDLEPFMPSPGEKAKFVGVDKTEAVVEVLRLEADNEDLVVVKNLDNGEESTCQLEHLCRIDP
jgi:hypothetical protein